MIMVILNHFGISVKVQEILGNFTKNQQGFRNVTEAKKYLGGLRKS
jgi:hypothetical protein